MTRYILFFVMLFFSFGIQAQTSNDFIQPYLTYKSCGEKLCLKNAILQEINTIITKEKLDTTLVDNEALFLAIRFVVDADGSIFPNSIEINDSSKKFSQEIREKLIQFSGINPVRNEIGKTTLESFELYLKMSVENGEVVSKAYRDNIEFNERKGYMGKFVAPIYKGCKSYKKNNKKLKKCLSSNVSKVISDLYDWEKASEYFDFSGTYKTFIYFVIDGSGKVVEVKCFSQTEAMRKEAYDAMKGIKKMTPGTFDGKPKRVFYSIPLTLRF